jgi:hypothetical protein
MKKIICLLFGAAMAVTAFTSKNISSTVQTQTTNEAIIALLDKFHKSFGNRDTATLRTVMTNPGLFCGTDPIEITNDREFALDYLIQSYFADTATVYAVNTREIQIASDEKSAISVEQFIYTPRSRYLPVRCNIHLIKIKDRWMIDSFVHSFVISPYDMEKINTVMPK